MVTRGMSFPVRGRGGMRSDWICDPGAIQLRTRPFSSERGGRTPAAHHVDP